MVSTLGLILLVSFCFPLLPGMEEDRERMITEVVNTNATQFRNYGCYCGAVEMGTGKPKDYIDVCCQILKCCYERLKVYQCDPGETSYNFTYDGRNIECYTANGYFWCEFNVCICDRTFSICLLDSHGLYNTEYIDTRKSDCLGMPPTQCPITKLWSVVSGAGRASKRK